MRLKKIANMVMDELFPVMDAEPVPAQGSSPNDPPDLVAHDKAYHHGHWDGKSKCKYRDDRAAALAGVEGEQAQKDIIDKLTPESVDGEDIDKADDLSGTETKSQADIDKEAFDYALKMGASWAVQPKTVSPDDQKHIDDLEAKLASVKSAKAKELLQWGIDRAKKKAGADETESKMNAVKAFAKMLGLDLDKMGVGAGGAQKKQGSLKDDIDMVRGEMRNVSPGLAALLSSGLDALAAGKDPIAGDVPKVDAKKAKDDEKAKLKAQKLASLKDFRDWIRKSPTPMKTLTRDEIDHTPDTESVAVDSAAFNSLWSENDDKNKLIAVSDLHELGDHGKEWDKLGVDEAGTVVVAGDITDQFYASPKYNMSADDQIKQAQKWIDKKLRPFCDKHKTKKFLMIPGNHDNILGIPEAKDLQWPSNVTFLSDQAATVNGMEIYGTGICEQRKGSSAAYNVGRHFELDDAAFKARADKIPEGLDLLIIHQPPKDAGYEGDKSFFNGTGANAGSDYLTKIIKEKKPKMVICGHLHDGDHRPYKIGDSIVINVARVQSRRDAAHNPQRVLFENNGYHDIRFVVDGEDNHLIK